MSNLFTQCNCVSASYVICGTTKPFSCSSHFSTSLLLWPVFFGIIWQQLSTDCHYNYRTQKSIWHCSFFWDLKKTRHWAALSLSREIGTEQIYREQGRRPIVFYCSTHVTNKSRWRQSWRRAAWCTRLFWNDSMHMETSGKLTWWHCQQLITIKIEAMKKGYFLLAEK